MASPHPSAIRVAGALSPFAAGFRGELARRGYTPSSTSVRMLLMAHLSCWLEHENLTAAELTSEVVDQFVRARQAEGRTWLTSARALAPLLDYLRALDVAPVPTLRLATTPLEQLLDEYATYLVRERALLPSTVRTYVADADLFLAELSGPAGLDLEHLSSSTVSGFVLQASQRHQEAPPGTAKMLSTLATSLRSLLRFLHAEGRTPLDLTSAVPSVAAWRLRSLPRALDPGQVALLLDSCDQATPIGRRDLAILTLLARLGLRSGEVAHLGLDDMDWRAGEIIVHGKGHRLDRLPVPADVGRAITSYLEMGRPRAECRRLFLRARAPMEGLSSDAIGMVVRTACDRAGLPQVGAHRLRHALATDMLAQGAPLSEIGQILRHVRPATTAIYAKVDRDRLQGLARPWPGRRP